jgi:Icc-related predicted phosphoesterase
MKILFTSDLHGHRHLYREITIQAEKENIGAVLLGGDLLPREGHDEGSLKTQRSFIREEIRPFLLRLKDTLDASVCIVLGNNDWAAMLSQFRELEKEGLLNILHQNIFHLTEDMVVVGYPFVPPTPFSPKDFEKRDLKNDPPRSTVRYPVISSNGGIHRIDEIKHFSGLPSIEEDLYALYLDKPVKITICVFHAPPNDTMLDRAYDGQPLGSKAVRKFIENRQPDVTLHGHIHESPAVSGSYWQRIGKTFSINPGQSGQHLSAVIFDSDNPEKTIRHTLYDSQKVAITSEESS